ncbi:MAG: aminotransferase class V-fold PLP-dependent enzyme [Anaerolineales bacterium]|nr:aminotransferase class V-fold PLP-dependent enzyme [Anaerolineales bacterium]
MKEHYLLDPDIIFLNHGSFGATPRPVLKAYQAWQTRLERQPVQFLGREIWNELKQARQILGNYLNADADDLVYIPNATFGVNIIARSLQLAPGDEILTTDHEYGACENVWKFVSQKNGAILVKQPIPLRLASPTEVAEQFWQGVTPKTRVIFISHITSPTAVSMPVEIICQKAREAGILTVIDGAHAPGQIPLDLIAMEPDFYLGNCHKWMQSSKGAGFLYTRPELQPLLEPLVVSWGWGENSGFTTGSKYLDYFEWSGTHDPSAYLSIPAAIQFQAEHHWSVIQERCQQILADGLKRIEKLTGLETVYSDQAAPFVQMAVVRLPRVREISAFQRELLQKYRIEVPCIDWNGQHFIRISVQAYNTEADLDTLVDAVEELLPQHSA